MSRNSPNLYELLKSANTKPSMEQPVSPGAAAGTAAAIETPVSAASDSTPIRPLEPLKVTLPPSASTQLRTPSLTAPKSMGMGERVVRVTYNTTAFLALLGVGLLFVSYAIGVRVGRSSTVSAATSQPGPLAPITNVTPAAPAVYTVRLLEWPARNYQEKTAAQSNASKMKSILDKAQLNGSETKVLADKVLLNYGRFTDTNANDAKKTLATLRDIRKSPKDEPYFKSASFVRVD